jgi:hypothetical protein
MPDDNLQITSTLPQEGFINLDLRPTLREEMPLSTAAAAHNRSLEFAQGFTEEQARHEASRCLRCDLAALCPTLHVIQPDTLKKAQAVR